MARKTPNPAARMSEVQDVTMMSRVLFGRATPIRVKNHYTVRRLELPAAGPNELPWRKLEFIEKHTSVKRALDAFLEQVILADAGQRITLTVDKMMREA